MAPLDTLSVPLEASHHKEQVYMLLGLASEVSEI